MRIDIFSDTICPWCFIGKRRLERALRQRPSEGIEIRWRPFQLNPDMPSEGMDRREYLRLKFGSDANARQIYDNVTAAGAAEGLDFAFDRMARTPNSVQSHRVIRYASHYGLENAAVEALFRAYFLEGRDIGSTAVLLEAGASAGLDPGPLETFLNGSAEIGEIRTEDLRARMAGINGVPCFVFNNRYALPGAQPPKVLLQMFDLAKQESIEHTEA